MIGKQDKTCEKPIIILTLKALAIEDCTKFLMQISEAA